MRTKPSVARLILALMILTVTTTYAQSPSQITYYQAIHIALSHNHNIKMAKARSSVALGHVNQLAHLTWPKLDITASSSRSNNPLHVFGHKLSQRQATFGDFGAEQYTGLESIATKPMRLNNPGFYHNMNAAVHVTIPIVSGGRFNALTTDAKHALMRSKYLETALNNQLAYEIYQTYHDILATQSLINIAKKNIKQAQQFATTTQQLLEQSITYDSDTLLAQNNLDNAQQNLTALRQVYQEQLDRFRTLLGKPASHYAPSTKSSPLKNLIAKYNVTNTWLSQNATLKALEQSLLSTKTQVNLAKSTYYPQINIHLQHDWNGNTLSNSANSDTVTVASQWKIMGYGSQGEIQSALANVNEVRNQYLEYKDQLAFQSRQAQRDYNQALNEIKTHQHLVSNGRKIVRELQQRFGRGLVPLSSLIETQAHLTQSEMQIIRAETMKKMANARLTLISSGFLTQVNK